MPINTSKSRNITFTAIKRCWHFQKGVADYHSGIWNDYTGSYYKFNATHLYEAGRLIAAASGRKKINEQIIAEYWNIVMPKSSHER